MELEPRLCTVFPLSWVRNGCHSYFAGEATEAQLAQDYGVISVRLGRVQNCRTLELRATVMHCFSKVDHQRGLNE